MIDKHMKHSKVLYTIFLLIISISAYSQDNFPDVRLGNKQFQKEKLIKYRVQQKGESYGFVNEESKFSIKPKFDNAADAIPFADSFLYPVSYNGKWGLLNQDGSYRVSPTLDKCPIPMDKNAVLCHQEGKILVVENSEIIDYNQLSFNDEILYIPDDTTHNLFIQRKGNTFLRSALWFRKEYSEKKIYKISTTFGDYFFSSIDDKEMFSKFGAVSSYILDYFKNPNANAIWNDSEISLWTDTGSIIFSGCKAITTGDGYILGLNTTDKKLFIYDGKTLVIDLKYENIKNNHLVLNEFLKSLNQRLINPLKHHQYQGRSTGDKLRADLVKNVTINTIGIEYTLITNKRGQCVFWNPGGEIVTVLPSGCTLEVIDAEKGHIKVTYGERYGFINTKTRCCIGPYLADESDLPKYDEMKRYKFTTQYDTEEFIANTERRYTIEEYEQYLYDIYIESTDRDNCLMYLNDNLLSYYEKPHYDEVRRMYDIVSPRGKWHTDIKTMEEATDGNIYTYDVVESNGFVIRQKRTSRNGQRYKPEIVINDFDEPLYITVEEFTGFTKGNLNNLSLLWKKQVGNAIYALYDFKKEDGQTYVGAARVFDGLTINPVTGEPIVNYGVEEIYDTQWKSVYNFVKINEMGIQNRMVLPNAYDRIRFKPDFITVKNSDSEILCMDYDFNPMYSHKLDEGMICDCIPFQNMWILVGSTTESGYIDHNNYYIVVTDSEGNMLSSTYMAVKGGVLTHIRQLESNKFEVVGNNTEQRIDSVKIQISVGSDGAITWL